MNALRIKTVIVALLMVAAFAGAHALRPTVHLADSRPKVDLEALFPKAFGDWEVDRRLPVQLIAPDTQAFLNTIYAQTLSRTYVNRAGERIMLSVAYGGDQSDATRAHRPEVCYPAQGFQIIASQKGEVSVGDHSIPVRQLHARMGGRNEPITYWITVGDQVTVSGTEQKLAQLSYGTRGIIPDGMLVRVSSIDADSAKGYKLQSQFVAQLAAALPLDRRAQVVGSAGG